MYLCIIVIFYYLSSKTYFVSFDYLTVEKELDDGFVIRIVRDKDGYEEIVTDFISKVLFDSCIRTGYLTEIEIPQVTVVSA